MLRAELDDRIAEANALKSLPANLPSPNGKGNARGGNEVCPPPPSSTAWYSMPFQNFHGLVQRLVQKEKQVLQLQTELDRFRALNPGEGREAVSSP
jgi:hypothetical protein